MPKINEEALKGLIKTIEQQGTDLLPTKDPEPSVIALIIGKEETVCAMKVDINSTVATLQAMSSIAKQLVDQMQNNLSTDDFNTFCDDLADVLSVDKIDPSKLH